VKIVSVSNLYTMTKVKQYIFKDIVLGDNTSKKMVVNGNEMIVCYDSDQDHFVDSDTGSVIPLPDLLYQCGDFKNEAQVKEYIERRRAEFKRNASITDSDEFANPDDSIFSTEMNQPFDEAEICKAMQLIHDDLKNQLVEIRIVKVIGKGGVYAGVFDNPEYLIKELQAFCSTNDYSGGIYMTLNSFAAEPTNKIQRASSTVRDKDITKRRWVLVDVDPEREPGKSSTDEEKARAFELLEKIEVYLKENFEIHGHIADSGNGYHLLIPVEIEESDDTRASVKEFLDALAKKFDSKSAKVDRTVHNASRITKLYGTFAKKGDDTAERPHRASKILIPAESSRPVKQEGYLKEITAKINIDLDSSMILDLSKAQLSIKPSKSYARALLKSLPEHFGANENGYETWMKVISAVNSEFSDAETVELIEEWSPGHKGEVMQKIKHPSQNVDIGFGWLVTLSKSYGFSTVAWENEYYSDHEAKKTASKSSKSKSTVKKVDLKMPDKLISSLPDVLQEYFEMMQEETDAPREFLLPPFITIYATLIGNKRYICGRRSIRIYPVFWTVLFAGSSSFRKSTAIDLAKGQFSELDNKFEQMYQLELIEYDAIKKKIEAADDKDSYSLPPKPIRKELYLSIAFSDATFWEELSEQEMLVSTPGEFTQLWDEVSRPHNSLGDFILEVFDVPNRLRRNTKNLGEMILKKPVWNIVSATTLDNFRSKLSQTNRGSGFLQRILPVCALEKQKHLSLLTYYKQTLENREIVKQVVQKIADLRLKDEAAEEMNVDGEAKQRYIEWSHKYAGRALEIEKRVSDFPGFASRLEVYALKYAIVFELMDDPNSLTVSLKSMNAAINIVEWHTKNTLYMLENNYIFDASYADRLNIRELLKNASGKEMTRSKLMQNSNFEKSRLDRALESEIEAGFIEMQEKSTGGSRLLKIYRLVKDKSGND